MTRPAATNRLSLLYAAIAVALISGASTPSKAQEVAPTPAMTHEAPRFYPSYSALIKEANGFLPIEQGPEFAGSSLLPFGSRDKAVAEAKEKALKSDFKTFVITHDQVEKRPDLMMGVHRIKMRGVVLLDPTPDNVILLLENGKISNALSELLSKTLQQPKYAALVPQLKAMVRADIDATRSGFPVQMIVRSLAAIDGKNLIGDFKTWAKYHRISAVRLESFYALIQQGELDHVENAMATEADISLKFMVDERLRKARLGA